MSDESEAPPVPDPYDIAEVNDPYQEDSDHSEYSETYRQWKKSKQLMRSDLKKNNY